jgi:hypothetical protein
MRIIKPFLQGLREGWTMPWGCIGMTFDCDPNGLRRRAYDHGLTLGQSIGKKLHP